jgi:hypothetical protein
MIKVTNNSQAGYDGKTAATSASIKDDLSDVLDDATLGPLDTQDALGATGSATVSGTAPHQTISWSGALPVHGQVIITYVVTVNPIVAGTGNQILTNTVVTPPTSGGRVAVARRLRATRTARRSCRSRATRSRRRFPRRSPIRATSSPTR